MNNIKKGLLGFVLVATLFVVGPVSQLSAVTHEENLAQINVLKSQLQAPQQAKPQPLQQLSSDSLGVDNFFYTWNTDLRYGMRNNNDVRALQQALISEGFYNGKINGNFYKITRRAVIKFQKKYGLKKNGIVGKAMREELNDLYGSDDGELSDNGTVTPTPTPPTTTTTPRPSITINSKHVDGVQIGSVQSVDWQWTGNETKFRIFLAGPINSKAYEEIEIGTGISSSSRQYNFSVPNIPVENYYKIKVCDSYYAQASFVCGESAPISVAGAKTRTKVDLDLVLEGVMLPVTGEVYKEVILTFAVINRGTATFERATYGKGVQWALGDLVYGVQYTRTIIDDCNTTINLAPGVGCNVRVGLTFSHAGTKTVPLTIDSNNLVPEINESNNHATKSIVISSTPTTTLNPSITITSPNGGEEWHPGETKRITWNSVDIDVVNISIYDINSAPNEALRIAVNTQNKGYYDWVIPSLDKLPGGGQGSSNYKIQIWYDLTEFATDVSDAPFSIVAPTTTIAPAEITVTSPPKGTNLVRGQKHKVEWKSTGLKGNVRLNVKKIDGDYLYVTTHKETLASSGQYVWTVENTLPPGSYKIEVFSPRQENGLGYDVSALSDPFNIIGITISY